MDGNKKVNRFSRRDFMINSVKGTVGITALSLAPGAILKGYSRPVQSFKQRESFPGDEEITIVRDNNSSWSIHLLSASAEGTFAAHELQRYLHAISSATLAVKKPENKTTSQPCIIVGLRADIPEQYKQLLPPPPQGYDGYCVVISKEPVVVIAGNNWPGTLYGVYDFLERIGCRWFYPAQDPFDPEVVPKLDTVSVKTGTLTNASPVEYRICNGDAWYFNMDYVTAQKQLDWAMKNRYNAMGWQADSAGSKRSLVAQYKDLVDAGLISELQKRGMFLHGPGHSFDQFLNSDQYFEQHPQWFGLRDGRRVPQVTMGGAQFSWSDHDAAEQFIDNAINFITQAPQIHIFSLWPFDGGVACECEQCKKAGGSSTLLMSLMDRLISRLKTIRPDLIVETICGYGPVSDLPDSTQTINPDLHLIWAQWGRNMEVGYDNPRYDKTYLDSWRKIARGGFTICQYYTDNFAEPWIMGPFTGAMESDRTYFLENKVKGFYNLGYSPGYWWNHGLNGHIAGQVFYNTNISPFDLIRDYALRYYGPEAGPLLASYYEEWAENIGLSYHIRHRSDEHDQEMLSEQRRKWINPSVAVTTEHKVFSHRVAKVEKLHSLAELIVETHELRNRIENYRKTGKTQKAKKLLETARIKTDAVMLMFYKLSSLKQGLIDYSDIGGFTQSSIKGWIDDEIKRINENNQHL